MGTTSFAIPLAQWMVPALAALGRSGVYEILAYLLVAIATYAWPLYERPQPFVPNGTPVVPGPPCPCPEWRSCNWGSWPL